MKLASLLFSALVCSLAASAQLQQPSSVHVPVGGSVASSVMKEAKRQVYSEGYRGVAAKTTAASSRWYSWGFYLDTTEQDNSGSVAVNLPYMWKDTLSMDAYSATGGGTVFEHNKMVSMGSILDPAYSGFNSEIYYDGKMKLTSSDSYALDSIIIWGHYGINPSKTAVSDTLRIVILTGNGTAGSDIFQSVTTNTVVTTRYGFSAGDSMKYYNIGFDSTVTHTIGTSAVIKDVIIDNTKWGDTTANGTYFYKVGFPAITVPAGGMVSASFTFISGDPAFVPHDTVFSSTMGYKYNMFRPSVIFRGAAGAPAFATYNVSNRNTGVFKNLPNSANNWTNRYVPLWFWSSGNSGSTLQYPDIDYHITCTSCGTIHNPISVPEIGKNNTVNVYPSPANDLLNIVFNASEEGDVELTLTDMAGKVVASKVVAAHANATVNAQLNVAGLAGGMYLYSIKTQGQLMTGKAMIAR